jgi:hypothetical protein
VLHLTIAFEIVGAYFLAGRRALSAHAAAEGRDGKIGKVAPA